MDGVSTMNLNDSDGGMTPLFPANPPSSKPPPQAPSQPQNLVYQPNVPMAAPPNAPEKNKSISKGMDSTPISDIMPGEDMLGPAGGGPDPRYMMAQQPMFVNQQIPIPQGYQQQSQKTTVASKNPLNLTDEQMEALLAGIVALLAFSGLAQDKLSSLVPKFMDEAGKRSTVGTLVTALLAAAIFYFGRRFVIRD
jgi:hypothetical protein